MKYPAHHAGLFECGKELVLDKGVVLADQDVPRRRLDPRKRRHDFDAQRTGGCLSSSTTLAWRSRMRST